MNRQNSYFLSSSSIVLCFLSSFGALITVVSPQEFDPPSIPLLNAQSGSPLNPCKSNPCQNGICSIDYENSTRNYHCYCEDGYTGVNCETDWNECWSAPCKNGGLCIDQVADYNCTCPPGYRGKVCEVNIDECLSDPCLNNGTCVDDVNGYFCECHSGFTGLNCETDVSICNTTAARKCANGGHCIDGLGEKHFCYCSPGWTGDDCEENVDECESSPCLHDGMCMDTPGSYLCGCQFGFTGLNCEIELEPCQSNPCLNDALCFMLDPETLQCYCVPDFHGPRCEYKYNDCLLPPLPKCFNGGTCLDGVDDFTCSCPGDYMGRHCECPLEDPENCVNVNESLSWVVDPSYLTTKYFEFHIETTSTLPEGNVSINESLVEIQPSKTSGWNLDQFPTSTSIFSFSQGLPIPPVTSLYLYETSGSLIITQSSLAGGVEGQISATPVFSQQSITIEPSLTAAFTSTSPSTESSDESSTIRFHTEDVEKEESPEEEIQTSIPSILNEKEAREEAIQTTLASTAVPSSTERTTTTVLNEAHSENTPSSETEQTTELPPPITEFEETPISTTSISNAEERSTEVPIEITTFIVNDFTVSTQDAPESTTTSDSAIRITTEVSSSVIDSFTQTTTNIPESSSSSSLSPEITPIHHHNISQTHEGRFQESLDGNINGSDFNDLICSKNVCSNGGTCLTTLSGVTCVCPLQYTGTQCEEEVFITTPGFVGHSGLIHRLSQENILGERNLHVDLSFRTSQEEGLILFTGEERGFLLIAGYIQYGILTFKISCGHQIILFSDPRHRVDTGYLQRISINITFLDKICATSIQLNETHTMSGEQEIDSLPRIPSNLYLGIVPQRKNLGNGIINLGFQGCMRNLQLNGQELNLYRDAVNGRDIVECETAICAIQPCRNGAVCAQHKESGSWFCDCPPGFTGPLCERPVCQTNPCQFGGTCLGSKTGSGFLCLCRAGRRGSLCQEEVRITQPSFRSSVGGYSSYLAYPVHPEDVLSSLEWQFHFSTRRSDQVALLFFLGQRGLHDFGSDFIALSYIKGHILMTWDLGAGPRRIFTKRPVDERFLVHAVRFGRTGRRGWLQVDNFPNITGLSPGSRLFLNVSSQFVYIGGHEAFNFSLLPHDFPVHRGFSGCIFDMATRSYATGQMSPLPLPTDAGPVRGRNVDQCHHDICASSPCSNGGTCIGYGASFLCECMDGRYGITCSEDTSACTTGMHKCAHDSRCRVTLEGSYECTCPFGKTGKYCEQDLIVSDPLFTGHGSYMRTRLRSAIRFNTHIHLEIRPVSLNGHLLHLGQSRNGRHQDYLSLLLLNGTLIFSFSLGGPLGAHLGNTVTLRTCCVLPNQWFSLEAGRYGRKGYLRLNGDFTTGSSETGLNTLDVDSDLYLGGIPESQNQFLFGDFLSRGNFYEGCLRNLHINERSYPLSSVGTEWTGWNIEDCDGTACGGELCGNGGKCVVLSDGSGGGSARGYECECPESYVGEHCQTHRYCQGACENGGLCSVGEDEIVHCDCPLGFHGPYCHDEKPIEVPRFHGDGFISFVLPETKSMRHLTSIGLSFKTEKKEGLLLWLGQDETSDDYLGLGLKDGLVHLVWNLGWFSRTELTVPLSVDDGEWHDLSIERVRQDLRLELDGSFYESRVSGSYHELNTVNVILLGGSRTRDNVQDTSRGHYSAGFNGCMRNVSVMSTSLQSQLTSSSKEGSIEGLNIDACNSHNNA